MTDPDDYDLEEFTPYLLNMAAEASSLAFQAYYKPKYGMLRTEWRVVFHLGRYGPLTAKEICDRAQMHKTKVSRAVAALADKRYLQRTQKTEDRRQETLALTTAGMAVFRDLYASARRFDTQMMAQFGEEDRVVLRRCLGRIAGL